MTFQQQQRTIAACFVGTLLALAAPATHAQSLSGEPLKIGYVIAQPCPDARRVDALFIYLEGAVIEGNEE
jgi:hypothetical protein